MRLPLVCLIAATVAIVIIRRYNARARDGSFEELKADMESIEADHSKLSHLNKVVAYRQGKNKETIDAAEIGNTSLSKDVVNKRSVICIRNLQKL